MGRLAGAVVAAGTAALLVPAIGLARTWDAPDPLAAGESTVFGQSASLGPGALVSVYQRAGASGSAIVARSAGTGGGFADAQVLADFPGWSPTVAADGVGEAVAAWDQPADASIQVSVRAPGGAFAPAAGLAQGSVATSEGPKLAVSPTGWAAVLFPVAEQAGQRARVSLRAPGGSFGPAEPVAPSSAGDPQIPRSVAVNDSGVVVVGYLQGGVAHVALRTSGPLSAWQPAQPLGEPNQGFSSQLPQVGIDAAGGAVAVWEEAGAQNMVAPLKASFRPPAGSFGPPQDLAVDSWDSDGPALGVSALGEVILVARPAIQEKGGVGLQPLVALSGSTVLRRFSDPRAVSQAWDDSSPLLAINARGDAVLTTVSCCPMRLTARRRAPFGAFDPGQDIVAALPIPGGSYYPWQIRDVSLDQLGNAAVTWTGSTQTAPLYVSRDAPALLRVAEVVLPSPLKLADLVAPPPPPPAAQPPQPPPSFPQPHPFPPPPFVGPGFWPLGPPPVAIAARPGDPVRTPPRPPARAPAAPFAVAVGPNPPASGHPSILVAVRCVSACRAAVRAVLVTPSRRRLALPSLALTLAAPGTVSAALLLTPAARRALAPVTRSRSRRRFTLTVTAVAGDASGRPQTATAELAFVRR